MKAGKALEQLVMAIQEYQKNNPDTHIVSNAILRDRAGVDREVDVFVRNTFQGENIGIAFECKDYKRKVGVNIVDEFKSKCNDIPDIHKGIIVSPSGFTDGAKKKAQFLGISLCQIDNVPLEELLNPFDILYTQCSVMLFSVFRAVLENCDKIVQFSDSGIYNWSDNKKVNMECYLTAFLRSHMPSIIPLVHRYLYSKRTMSGDVPLSITPPDRFYVFDIEGGKHMVKELIISLKVTLKSELQKIIKQSLYINTLKESPVVRISEYKRKDGKNFLLLHGNDKYIAFVKDTDGSYKETLFVTLRS